MAKTPNPFKPTIITTKKTAGKVFKSAAVQKRPGPPKRAQPRCRPYTSTTTFGATSGPGPGERLPLVAPSSSG